ncbi:hypothetical protein [Dyella sp.]|uniref:hypothetical protein n=1 Tax=Dyella sp. TaxID=1869338 RepID=UPI002D767AFD|nr:hypothetical protein [Dyella sp.]HET7331471.1 hypothetical protein [Dyella sp.]
MRIDHGIKEADEAIWLVSFMHYDLGYFDLKQKTPQPFDSPFDMGWEFVHVCIDDASRIAWRIRPKA